jgi:hypothetical protein
MTTSELHPVVRITHSPFNAAVTISREELWLFGMSLLKWAMSTIAAAFLIPLVFVVYYGITNDGASLLTLSQGVSWRILSLLCFGCGFGVALRLLKVFDFQEIAFSQWSIQCIRDGRLCRLPMDSIAHVSIRVRSRKVCDVSVHAKNGDRVWARVVCNQDPERDNKIREMGYTVTAHP